MLGMRYSRLVLAGVLAVSGSVWLAASTAAVVRTFAAYQARLATKAPLTGATHAGSRLVAVGDFGIVLLSDDTGRSWRQAKSVPVRSMLTAVTFADDSNGWAVGHGGIVLATHDGGESWALVHSAGADVSLLSVWFGDAAHGIAVGAFGFAIETGDGGKTWKRITVGEGEDGDRHLNQIFAGRDQTLYVAAETGTVFVSRDRGRTWSASTLPYNGSMWGGMALREGPVLVWGMRGHVLRSDDAGRSWSEVPTGTDRSFSGGAQFANGMIVLAGLGGAVATSRDGGRHFQTSIRPDRGSYTAVVEAPGGRAILAGGSGVLDAEKLGTPGK